MLPAMDLVWRSSHMNKAGLETDNYYSSFKDETGEVCAVYRNPSLKEFDNIVLEVNEKFGRGWFLNIKALLSKKDLYMWHGEILHSEMSDNLGITGTALIPLYTDPTDSLRKGSTLKVVWISTTMMSSHRFSSYIWPADKDTILHTVQKHKNLKAVMDEFRIDEE
jgi:hypothetical protein